MIAAEKHFLSGVGNKKSAREGKKIWEGRRQKIKGEGTE